MANMYMKRCLTSLIRKVQIKTTMDITPHLLVWMLSKEQNTIVGEVMNQLEHFYTDNENAKRCSEF